MAKFTTKDGKLFIDDKLVLRGWESFSGWYWFATEVVEERKAGPDGNGGSLIDGKGVDDTIFFGYVQGFEEEWGDFSLAELNSCRPQVWELRANALPYSGRRNE